MNPSLPTLRYSGVRSVLTLFLVTLGCMILGSILVSVIVMKGQTTPSIRIATLAQDIVMFILPALITAMLLTRLPATLLAIDTPVRPRMLAAGLLMLILAIPALSTVETWNASMHLPASLSGVEQWMRASEDNAAATVKLMFGGPTVADLIVSLLIVAVLAGVSEELFFRGALQRLLSATRLGPHGAIWFTAIFFSAVHMQFFGFFPRMILGLLMGYALYWSGSLWVSIAMHVLNNGSVVYMTWRNSRMGELSEKVAEETASNTTSFGLPTDSPVIFILSLLSVAVVMFYFHNLSKKALKA